MRMFRESFNDLRAWYVLQGGGKRERGLISNFRKCTFVT
jgi:hypothetical protein